MKDTDFRIMTLGIGIGIWILGLIIAWDNIKQLRIGMVILLICTFIMGVLYESLVLEKENL